MGDDRKDHIGCFAVTVTGDVEDRVKRFEETHDDYSAILLKALADRLVEALAECLHERVRKFHWGYASHEDLSNEALIKEEYSGIRPAPGYPACPHHLSKINMFNLLKVEEHIGIQLTESMAMYPASSICGWYFSHPDSKYFAINHIGRDQMEDYSRRLNGVIPKDKRIESFIVADIHDIG